MRADAADLPFADGTFDRVLCQAGLQYFPDRIDAVREMRRVLRQGGRLAALVWGALEHSPGFAALATALGSVVGPEAAAVMRAPFVFGDDRQSLAVLLEAAGLVDVAVEARRGEVRFGSVEDFVRYQCAGSPLAAHVDPDDVGRLTALVAEALGGRAGFPIEAALATGVA
jgi:SAM-dependent methyltransferase